jgi:predicted DNA-binding WGR domain protein
MSTPTTTALAQTTANVVHLEYSEGASDKFYTVYVVSYPDGTHATFNQYGRNGTVGAFTPVKPSVTLAAAQTAANKAVAGKQAKGYRVTKVGAVTVPAGSDGDQHALFEAADRLTTGSTMTDTPVVAIRENSAVVSAVNSAAVSSRIEQVTAAFAAIDLRPGQPVEARATVPMLASTINPEDIDRIVASDDWVVQHKLDGDRVVIEVIDGNVRVLNRAGQPKVKNVGAAHLAPFKALTEGRWVIDGEMVGRKFWAFDLAAAGSFFDEAAPFGIRSIAVGVLFAALDHDDANEHVGLVSTLTGTAATKRAFLDDAQAAGKEGVIFRRTDAAYQPGSRSQHLLKHKFTHTVDAVVMAVGVGGKENIEVGVYRDGGLLSVGQVTTIGKGAFAVGDVVEVLFLNTNSFEAPRLFQPRIVRKRHDKAPAECVVEQLRHTVANRTVEG